MKLLVSYLRRIWSFVEAVYYLLLCTYRISHSRKAKRVAREAKMLDDVVCTTRDGVEVRVYPGKKSPHDFIVKFQQQGRRERTPRHVHLIVELYVKEAFDKEVTHSLCKHFLHVFDKLEPITGFPPTLQYFRPEHVDQFTPLDEVGEFSVEFLLVVNELIMIQEKTNYPQGSLTRNLYGDFVDPTKDRFSVINTAVYH